MDDTRQHVRVRDGDGDADGGDIEKGLSLEEKTKTAQVTTLPSSLCASQGKEQGQLDQGLPSSSSFFQRLASHGVETRGIHPVALKDRNDRRPINIFSFWWTASLSLLPITTGLVGTYFDGLSLEATCLTILFFSLAGALPPACLGLLGPQTGLRQMVQARYSFGLYFVGVVALLNLATTTGWTIVSAIVAGQTLSAVSGGGLSWAVGIVIISLIGLTISFMGYRVVHAYERFAWIPALIAIVITVGCGGHLLKMQAPTDPAKASTVLTYGCVVTGFLMSWATMVSDFCVYIHPSTSKIRIFSYTYFGLLIPTVPLMCLGAAIGGAIPSIPAWETAYGDGAIGGVALAMLHSTGGFGKFVTVVLAFSVLGNMAGSMYSISVQFQILLGPVSARVPRFVYSIVITAVVIAVSIPISHEFEESLESFLGVICYWVAIFVAIVSTEHLYFRRGDASSYDHAIWNVGHKLPPGLAAMAASILPFGLIIPCMDESWYTGPIAKTTGDIGFEVGLVLGVLFYLPFRTLERRITGR
ncbi:hypothetical protein A1O3_03639 [Capronia epimyces CBS 606.96]|uniref:Purine-cytosine permease n=1 Tax=Capronia epimyces CBS 606.96 TaxID=1182542 RepID=W9YBP6_9EURO|nr:uncharacterized protein A1O3_03639 [Capronia epimyces CBS 606.96]EXJ86686.1 hypothetical protein A1O3_03639 [Capronia epimyces CBS 606.96]